MDVGDRLSSDLAFARHYVIFSNVFFLAASAVLLSAVTASANGGISLEAAGDVLAAPWMLALLCFLEIAKVAFSKRLSGHTTVFALPHYINPVRGDLSKGPWLKKTVLGYVKRNETAYMEK